MDASSDFDFFRHAHDINNVSTSASADKDDNASRIMTVEDDDPENPANLTALPRASSQFRIPIISSVSPTLVEPTGPPPLNYTLRTRKLSIAFFWSLILFDSIAVPIGLYFGLWYGTSLSPNAVFSISTGCLGGVSIIEYILRFYRLWKKGSTCRVLNARRWYLDWFHWNFSAAWIFIMVELIVGTIPERPPIRLLAMPVASLVYWFGFSLVLQDTLRWLGYNCPIRISSVQEGEPFRPGIYSIIEDIVAVDGSGGTQFRAELNARYEASHQFRQMLHRLTMFWGVGALFAATLTTILIFTLSPDPAYVVGWVLPFLWAGVWTLATFWYVKRCLRYEHEHYGQPAVSKA